MLRILIAIALLSFTSVAITAPSYPSCNIEERASIPFRSLSAKDHIKVSIRGAPCYEARLSIEITAEDGKRLYTYNADFKRHTAEQWDDPDLPGIAAKLAKSIVTWREKKTTSDLPPWLPPDDYYEKYYEEIKVSKDRYEHLRKQHRPIFTHPTHYEERRSVISDPSTGRSEVILEGGV